MLEYVYQATGLLLIAFAVQTFVDKSNKKRIGTGLFWLIYGLSFSLGKVLPDWFVGIMVLSLTLIAACGLMGSGSYGYSTEKFRMASAKKLKNTMFLPAIIIPVVTILWAKTTGTSALIGLGISALLALIVALIITKGKCCVFFLFRIFVIYFLEFVAIEKYVEIFRSLNYITYMCSLPLGREIVHLVIKGLQ